MKEINIEKLRELRDEYVGSAKNEHIWALGAEDDVAATTHEECHDKYNQIANALSGIIDIYEKKSEEELSSYADELDELLRLEEQAGNTGNAEIIRQIIAEIC